MLATRLNVRILPIAYISLGSQVSKICGVQQNVVSAFIIKSQNCQYVHSAYSYSRQTNKFININAWLQSGFIWFCRARDFQEQDQSSSLNLLHESLPLHQWLKAGGDKISAMLDFCKYSQNVCPRLLDSLLKPSV